MSDSQTKGENSFKSETKYKQFSSAIEKALKTFEGLTEWHDLISSLARINKVLLAYKQYPVVPLQLTVCKRLTQCLHPNLPSGVHLKTLDVYAAIFDRIGPQGLLSNLVLYSSGLFPLLTYASMSVRPHLLDIYEKYFLPLGVDLIPTLHGFVLGLLPGLEDESEHTERICSLFDALSNATDKSIFFYALWQCVLGSPDYRAPAVNLILTKLNKKQSAEDQVYCLGGNLPLVVSGVCAALMDKNVLVQRGALDIVTILFPFHQSFLLQADLTSILTAALHTLLKRDVSLSRRLYVWLLGTQVLKSSLVSCMQPPSSSSDFGASNESEGSVQAQNSPDTDNLVYFEKYSRAYLNLALRGIMVHAAEAARQNSSKVECVLPYRLLRALLDRTEISTSVMDSIMLDLVMCLRDQIEAFGGVSPTPSPQGKDGPLSKSRSSSLLRDGNPSKKLGKKGSLKADIMQSANLLLSSLSQEFVWGWMAAMLKQYLSAGPSRRRDQEVNVGGESPMRERFSPVSDHAGESPFGGGAKDAGEGDRSGSLGLKSLLEVVIFFLKVMPRDSMESVYLRHMSQLLLQMATLIKAHHALLSLKELDLCHEICLHLLNKLLRTQLSQPSSLASTPSTPATPSMAGRSLASVVPTHGSDADLEPDSILSLTIQVYDNFSLFFSEFLEDRFIPDVRSFKYAVKDLHVSLSGACQVVVLIHKLLRRSELMNRINEVSTDEQSSPPSVSATAPTAPTGVRPWLHSLMTLCREHTKPDLALVALETLLKLVEMVQQGARQATHPPPPAVRCRVLSTDVVNSVMLTQDFVEVITEMLWHMLCSGHCSMHVQVVSLLAWLHSSLTGGHNACEMVILEQFASQGLSAHQVFAIFWQYLPTVYHSAKIKPFYRAVLRMLEGLQSNDSAVRSLTESWVRAAITEGGSEGTHRLLQPLVRILLESDTKRKHRADSLLSKKITLSRQDAEKDMKYAKYYFQSLGIENPYLPTSKNQYMEVIKHYSQTFDASQILYALSLLQLVVGADSSGFISTVGNTVIDISMYNTSNMQGHAYDTGRMKAETPEASSPSSPPPFPTLSSQKSLLEVILSACMDLLCSEYHPSFKASAEEQVENLRVKICCASLLSRLLSDLLRILAGHSTIGSSDDLLKVCSPNFVSALLTLCDIQKVVLLLMGKAVEWWCEVSLGASSLSDGKKGVWSQVARQLQAEGGSDPGVIMRSFFTHLLRVVQCLIVLDTQFSQSLPIKTNPPLPSPTSDLVTFVSGVDISAPLPAIVPGCATASQQYFREFLLQVLSEPTLADFHDDLLHMFTSTTSNLLSQQLTDLAPRIVKQLCSSIEEAVQGSAKSAKSAQRDSDRGSNVHLSILYFDCILTITTWCLFGDTRLHPFRGEAASSVRGHSRIHHRSLNPFLDIARVKQAEKAGDNLSPTSKQPSTMDWLLGVFTGQKMSSVAESDSSSNEARLYSRVGVSSQAGQHVVMLLPAVYNSMTDMWLDLHLNELQGAAQHGGSFVGVVTGGAESVESSRFRKQNMVFEDIEQLFGQFLCTLAEREPTTFFSSISHIWLEWNLDDRLESNKRLSLRKDAFIDMLHHIKILPLQVLISCLQSTLSDIMEEYESSILRQKYLLHFFYKYISSTRQSSKELTECRVCVVSFLREYHHQVYNPTPQGLLASCHTLCMLTSILHVLICRVPPPDPKTQKKERKELQEVTHKLCENLSMVANIGVTHPDYIMVRQTSSEQQDQDPVSREGDVVPSAEEASGSPAEDPSSGLVSEALSAVPSVTRESREVERGAEVRTEEGEKSKVSNGDIPHTQEKKLERSSSEELLQPTLQALAVLSNVLAHFIDCVFGGSEKDKVTALLKAVLFNIWPHLHNHSVEHHQCYLHCSKLLASLSGFQVTRKSWRKEVFDLFLASDFFVTSSASLREWKVTVDNLMTQDQITFRDLLTRLHSTTAPGVVNLFSSLEQEIFSGALLLKRMAFAIFSGEVDQYVKYLPDIQEKLSEYLKVFRYPSICCEVLLMFKVLLLRLSPHHLMSFWPAMTAELISLLSQLESNVQSELSEPSQGGSSIPKPKLQLYLSACKLLDTALALPPEHLPHFQWLQWGFISHGMYVDSDEMVVTRLCKHFRLLEYHKHEKSHTSSVNHTPPYLRCPSVTSLGELKPLFDGLVHMHGRGPRASSQATTHLSPLHHSSNRISLVEDIILQDFLQPVLEK